MAKSKKTIPYGRQSISQADIDAVIAVLSSDYLTQGPAVAEFERAVAERVGAAYAIASNSATSSLHLACLALGIGPGDVVWTTPITFVASANCARYCGASVDFVDIDPLSYNVSVDRLRDKLEHADKHGQLPKAVVVVHLAGHPADMAPIRSLSQRYGFFVIEDASHAIGGSYRSTKIGSCTHSDITIFSFHPVKVITSGEGGMALTNDGRLARKMARLNSHGITRQADELQHSSDGPWYYEQLELGYNYRMTDIHAALGLSQLTRLEEFVSRRHSLARRYDEALTDLPLVLPWRHEEDYSGFHLYVVRLRDVLQQNHRAIFEALRERGVLVNLHYIPIYRQPDYEPLGFSRTDFPQAENYYASAMSIPLYPALSEGEQDEVVLALREVLG